MLPHELHDRRDGVPTTSCSALDFRGYRGGYRGGYRLGGYPGGTPSPWSWRPAQMLRYW